MTSTEIKDHMPITGNTVSVGQFGQLQAWPYTSQPKSHEFTVRLRIDNRDVVVTAHLEHDHVRSTMNDRLSDAAVLAQVLNALLKAGE